MTQPKRSRRAFGWSGGARSAELSLRGRDGWDRLVQVATAGLRDGDRAWGAAMRAELANVDERGERRRFALGCTASALRLGPDGVTWLVAAGAAGLAQCSWPPRWGHWSPGGVPTIRNPLGRSPRPHP